jgi:hypothetical protein
MIDHGLECHLVWQSGLSDIRGNSRGQWENAINQKVLSPYLGVNINMTLCGNAACRNISTSPMPINSVYKTIRKLESGHQTITGIGVRGRIMYMDYLEFVIGMIIDGLDTSV